MSQHFAVMSIIRFSLDFFTFISHNMYHTVTIQIKLQIPNSLAMYKVINHSPLRDSNQASWGRREAKEPIFFHVRALDNTNIQGSQMV
jgi:hypothetical protein